jgi:hypothetical protein
MIETMATLFSPLTAAVLLLASGVCPVTAQGAESTQRLSDLIDMPSLAISAHEEAIAETTKAGQDLHLDRLLLSGGVAAFCLGSYLTYGALFWWDESPGDFHMTAEGNMEEDSYAGGSDKFGHAWACYVLTRVFGGLLRWSGAGDIFSEAVGALAVQAIFLFAEIEDAFYDYGFSWWDMAFNIAGSVLGVLFDLIKPLDDIFDFRIWYWPTSQFVNAEFNPAEDYSGQFFFLVVKLGGIPLLRDSGLRFIEIYVGYHTRGYKPLRSVQERLVFVGLSLDLLRMLTDWVLPLFGGADIVRQGAAFVLEYWHPHLFHAPLAEGALP